MIQSKGFRLFLFSILFISSSSAVYSLDKEDDSIDPALFIFGQEPSDNEFPRRVGTIRREDDGFTINFDDGNPLEFVGNVTNAVSTGVSDIFNFFTGIIEPTTTSTQLKQVNESRKPKVSPKAKINSDSDSSYIEAKNKNKQTTEKIAKLNKINKLKNKDKNSKAEVEDRSIIAGADAKVKNSNNNQDDWRYNRKWWQRGSPIL